MKNRLNLSRRSSLVAIVLCLASASTLSAITITPTGTAFGSLPAATFGGSGIPNDSVQITTEGNLTLGLTATPRYANPPVTNDGAGTFFAGAGGDTLNGAPTFGQWNFDYYVSGLAQFQTVRLYYDNDASVGNNVANYFESPLDGQDSWNLGMAFLNGGIFNPNASGEYGFALVAYQYEWVMTGPIGALQIPVWTGREIGRSAILVNVGSVPDSGNTVLMIGSVLVGLTLLRRPRGK